MAQGRGCRRRGARWHWLALPLLLLGPACASSRVSSGTTTAPTTAKTATTPTTAASTTTKPPTTSTATPTTRSTTATTAATTTTKRPTTTAKPRPKVAYPAGGAVDPVFPPGDDAYGMLVDGRCDVLLTKTQEWDSKGVADVEGQDTVFVYRSAAEACLGRWADAVRDFGRITKPQPALDDNCPRTEAFKWVSALIQSHDKDATFAPVFQRATTKSACASTTTSSSSGTSTSTSTTVRSTTTTTTR